MTALFFGSVMVALPYLAERLHFRRKFGLFAFLFWLFVCQVAVLLVGGTLSANSVGSMLPAWLSSLGIAISGLTLLTIGFTPLTAAVLAAAFVLVASFGKVFGNSRD